MHKSHVFDIYNDSFIFQALCRCCILSMYAPICDKINKLHFIKEKWFMPSRYAFYDMKIEKRGKYPR